MLEEPPRKVRRVETATDSSLMDELTCSPTLSTIFSLLSSSSSSSGSSSDSEMET